MVFNAVFNSAPIHAFLVFFQPVLRTIFFSSHWLLSHIAIVQTMDSGFRGMNLVAMTIINPRKEYWPNRGLSNQRLPVLKSATLPTELWGWALLTQSMTQIHNLHEFLSMYQTDLRHLQRNLWDSTFFVNGFSPSVE